MFTRSTHERPAGVGAQAAHAATGADVDERPASGGHVRSGIVRDRHDPGARTAAHHATGVMSRCALRGGIGSDHSLPKGAPMAVARLPDGHRADGGTLALPAAERIGYETLPLAESKLLPPRLRAEMVARRRVQVALERDDVKLTLVAAPPGYGKTVAARTWYESSSGAVAWVTLDAGDNDLVRFWTYAATAVDRVREGLGRGALQRLRSPGGDLES